jgi:SAM-dependent methyltransferase
MSDAHDNNRDEPRIFSDLAHLWPLLSPPEDYVPEAESVHRILARCLGPALFADGRRPRLLELGAGGGHTIYHLTDRYEITAVDLSPEMLANCARLNPSVETVVGDMRDLRLERIFDAVLIHDAIDYLVEAAEVEQTLATAAAHLAPGGIVLVAPTYVAETFVEHEVEHDHHSDGDTDLTYFSYVHRLPGNGTRVETVLIYLVRRDGQVEVVEDRHANGLFSTAEWIEMLGAGGFAVTQDYLIAPDGDADIGVPMFVGRSS